MTDYDPDFEMNGCVQRIGLAMNLLALEEENLRKLIATVERAHSIGTFIDPTKYRDALYRGDMDAISAVAQSLLEPIRVWNERVAPKIQAPS